jgi:hypothetical protein
VNGVVDQLGHADPALTLRAYAPALRNEETDLSFANSSNPKRTYKVACDELETEEDLTA